MRPDLVLAKIGDRRMHKIMFADTIVSRVLAARGKLHVYDRIDARRAALIVIDMQNAYLVSGQPALVKGAYEILPNVNRLAAATRAAGGSVFFVRQTVSPSTRTEWSLYLDEFGGNNAEKKAAALTEGAYGHQISDDLVVLPEDIVINKFRYSAFAHGSSNIHSLLTDRGIDTLIIVGTVTGVCCATSAQDAMMLNYKVHVVSDATASHSDEEQNAALGNLMGRFADIRSTDEILELLRHRGAK